MFTYVDSLFGISKIIGDTSLNLDNYIVPQETYNHLLTLFKSYKYILAKNIYKSVELGINIPILFKEPINTKDKMVMLPTSMTNFLKKYNNKLASFTDISTKASYSRDTVGVPEILKIHELTFYNYCQLGYLNYICYNNSDALIRNIKFIKSIAESFAILISKCISATFPIAAEINDYEKLIYISLCFAYQSFFGLDVEKAKAQALTFRRINKMNITTNCKYYSLNIAEIDMDFKNLKEVKDSNGKMVKLYPIDVFLSILKNEFNILKVGNIEYRNLSAKWTQMYGQNSILAIEHCFSFITMIKSACMKVGLYTDLMIENMIGIYIDELDKSILMSI
jgi:hypothetical protein